MGTGWVCISKGAASAMPGYSSMVRVPRSAGAWDFGEGGNVEITNVDQVVGLLLDYSIFCLMVGLAGVGMRAVWK